MATNYFPRKSESAPKIYAYEDKYDPNVRGLLKVGYTTIGVPGRGGCCCGVMIRAGRGVRGPCPLTSPARAGRTGGGER